MATAVDQPYTRQNMPTCLDLPTSPTREPTSISPEDLLISPIDELNPQYSLFDQDAEIFLPDLSWDALPSSAASQDPPISLQNFQLPSDASSSCQVSSKSSSSPSCAACPIDPAICSPPYFCGARPDDVQQDIESCVPPLSDVNDRAAESLLTSESCLNARIVSSSGKKYPSRTKAKKLSGGATPSALGSDEVAQRASVTRTAHSAVERRYRNNLNVYLDKLQALLSAAAKTEDGHYPGGDRVDADKPKTKKAAVLLGAIEYVKRSEREKQETASANWFLKQRLVALEKLVKCEDCSLLRQMNMLNCQVSNVPIGAPDTILPDSQLE